ncbi:hypothetical protein T484DRAFT_1849285 [Baffinella frigidus]|nr:hypothetical protein T484DRAFT_1849285 [Cryptophyta sp. CCMP2293]
MERDPHEEHAGCCDASTVRMLSLQTHLASSEPEHASSDAEHALLVLRLFSLQLHPHSEASASSAHDDHTASPHQHPATHHHDPASPCTTFVSADDFVRRPSDIGVRRMFDLMNASCDPASQRGAWSNLEENVEARNILRNVAVEAEDELGETSSLGTFTLARRCWLAGVLDEQRARGGAERDAERLIRWKARRNGKLDEERTHAVRTALVI